MMFGFLDFLTEEKEEFNENDAKGKLFEILVGSHLKHGQGANGRPADFLTHYRDDEGKSPKSVHDNIKRELESRNPGLYEQINEHAAGAARHLRHHLSADGHEDFHDIAWTSQPSDHNSFTGVQDPNSDADVMLRTNKGPIGVSLKYGSQKDPNLRNPGLASIEALAGTDKGDITSIFNQHQNNLRDIGFDGTIVQNHSAYKKDKNSPQSKQAEASSLESRKQIAKKWQDGYSRKTSDELKDTILSLAAPKTVFKHYRLHTRTGLSSGVEHHLGGVEEELANSLSNYDEFKALPHSGDNISVQILGRHKGSDAFHPVLQHAVKGVSGPMKGMAGTTKLILKTPKIRKETNPEESGSDEHGGKSFYAPGEKE